MCWPRGPRMPHLNPAHHQDDPGSTTMWGPHRLGFSICMHAATAISDAYQWNFTLLVAKCDSIPKAMLGSRSRPPPVHASFCQMPVACPPGSACHAPRAAPPKLAFAINDTEGNFRSNLEGINKINIWPQGMELLVARECAFRSHAAAYRKSVYISRYK